MAYTFACRNLGLFKDCLYVARGDTIDEVLADAEKHAKEVHGLTNEQVNDPETKERVKALIKEV
ncbi:DUF1059 domain-containing protein [Chloroflexota bacterium]